MLVVLQGETGGAFDFPYPSYIPAASGFVYTVAEDRVMYRFDGYLASGALYVAKSGLANLPVGRYTTLSWVIDTFNLQYFVQEDDLVVTEVPDFFTNAVLTSGDSVLVRLSALEHAFDTVVAGDRTYRHVQMLPSAIWTIHHNLNKYTSVMVKDSAGDNVYGDWDWVDSNTMILTFSAAFSGEAYCN